MMHDSTDVGLSLIGTRCVFQRAHDVNMLDINGLLEMGGTRRQIEAVVRLEDVTMADAPSRVLAETRLACGPEEACAFSLHVPDDALEDGREYVLSARGIADPGSTAQRVGTTASHPWRMSERISHRLILEKLD